MSFAFFVGVYPRIDENGRVTLVCGVIQNFAECGHRTHRERVSFDFSKAEFCCCFWALQNQVLECEQHVGVDVLVVCCPAARRKAAFVAEESSLEVVQVESRVGGVVENVGILVKVVTVGRVLCGVPQGECSCRTVVITRTATSVESREIRCLSHFVSVAVVKERHHHVFVDVLCGFDERI